MSYLSFFGISKTHFFLALITNNNRIYLFSGVLCYCSNSFIDYGTSNICNSTCKGDSSEICGGKNANNIYTTPFFVPTTSTTLTSSASTGTISVFLNHISK